MERRFLIVVDMQKDFIDGSLGTKEARAIVLRAKENCTVLVERLVGIVDPLLSGVLMVTVGLSLLSVMLPLIGMMNSVG